MILDSPIGVRLPQLTVYDGDRPACWPHRDGP